MDIVMNTITNTPIKLIVLDDNEDTLKIFSIMFEEQGIHNIELYSCYVQMFKSIDKLPHVYLIDYHLGANENGGSIGKRIHSMSPDSEIIYMSSLLQSEDYEELINNCGANAIARKEDFDKLVFLIKRAKKNINKGLERAMDILIHSEAVLKKIREY